MSGICGIVSLTADQPSLTDIEEIIRLLERRGPDATNHWLGDRAVLGNTLLATTPEAILEKLPLTEGSAGCTITADARLDNRQDLITKLGLLGSSSKLGDGELILRAYLQWGHDCPNQLIGDFAFAIWDPRSETLFCARDHMGMRQLIYHHQPGRLFVFATEVDAVVCHPLVIPVLNSDRIGDYLGNMEGADLTSTFYAGVYRLPPAHILKVDASGLAVQRYWHLKAPPPLLLPSDEAYADAFLEVFSEAVGCRLRGLGQVGAMLSGGLDSNSVVAMALELQAKEGLGPLPTFSAVGPDPETCIETRTILAATRLPARAATSVDHTDLGEMESQLVALTMDSAEPFDGSMTLVRAVYLAARRAGINVVLDGVASDAVLSCNLYPSILLRRGRIGAAIKEVRGEQRYWGAVYPAWRELLRAGWHAFLPAPIKRMRFWAGRRKADRDFIAQVEITAPTLVLHGALLRRKKSQKQALLRDQIDALTQVRAITNPDQVVGRERYDRVASALQIEPRDPFLDIRMIDFCLSLPREQLQRDGWSKWILRNAMSRLLPPQIVWRLGKQHLGVAFTSAIWSGLAAHSSLDGAVAADSLIPSRHNLLSSEDLTFLSAWFHRMKATFGS